MKTVISIFILPYEIDELEYILTQLRKNFYNLTDKNQFVLDITLSLSDELVDWNSSNLPKSYFQDKFSKLEAQTDYCTKHFRTSTQISGCVSQRRNCLLQHKDATFFIWLDTDIIFEEVTLFYLQSAMQAVSSMTPLSIITPEIVRVWDTSWDCLVSEKFINEPLDYQKSNDPFRDCGLAGEVSLQSMINTTAGQPRFKFAGGWFTCISADLLRRIGIPESFGHYGYEDTFVMWASEKLVTTKSVDIQQFKLKNLVVCENYKYRNNNHYIQKLSLHDRKEQFKQIAASNFTNELNKIL